MSGPTRVIVSYVPLLAGRPGEHLRGDLIEHLVKGRVSAPMVRAMYWIEAEGEHVPVLVVDQARAVVEHLVAWAEGHPEEWFEVQLAITPLQYSFVLMPDLQKSIQRYRTARRILHGEVVPASTPFKIICRPLAFTSQDVAAIASVQIADPMRAVCGLVPCRSANGNAVC
jgi:hypothetical protein